MVNDSPLWDAEVIFALTVHVSTSIFVPRLSQEMFSTPYGNSSPFFAGGGGSGGDAGTGCWCGRHVAAGHGGRCERTGDAQNL